MKKSTLIVLSVAVALCIGITGQGQSAPKKSASEQQAARVGLTSATVKSYITKKEKALATGVGSAHKSVTLTFENIRFGTPRKTNARDRVVNGIEGPMVFPVRVKYTSHRSWGNGDKEDKKIHYDYEFYKDSYNDWNTYQVGPVNN